VVIAIAAAIWWNDWDVGIRPGREAHKAMEPFHRGAHWTDALLAADSTLPAGRQFSGHCRLADGQLAYFGRWKSGYMTQLPDVSREFRTRDLWRAGLEEQLVQPHRCRSLVISVNRDYDFDVALDDRDAVVKVKQIEDQ
jgi:hypothetical protein